MKGIILETREKEAVILYDNGIISKIKNKNYEKGQVLKMNNKSKLFIKAGSIAAAFLITAGTGFAYIAPQTYVSLDVNPSIEYKLNSFDRVISVVAVNDDGEKIVQELDVQNDKITKAVLKTLEKLKAEGYLTEDEFAGVVIAVSNKSNDKSDKIANEIEEELDKDEEKDIDNEEKDIDNEEKDLDDEDETNKEDKKDIEDKEDDDSDDQNDEDSDIDVIVEAVGRERVEEARKLNVTPGKLNLVQKLIAASDDFDDITEEQLQQLLKLSVKEINKMTQAYNKGLDVEYTFEVDEDEDESEELVDNKDKKESVKLSDVKQNEKEDDEKNEKLKQQNEKKNIKEEKNENNNNGKIKDKENKENKDRD